MYYDSSHNIAKHVNGGGIFRPASRDELLKTGNKTFRPYTLSYLIRSVICTLKVVSNGSR